jgi:hypothetical protein
MRFEQETAHPLGYLIITAFELGAKPAHHSRIVMPATAINRPCELSV